MALIDVQFLLALDALLEGLIVWHCVKVLRKVWPYINWREASIERAFFLFYCVVLSRTIWGATVVVATSSYSISITRIVISIFTLTALTMLELAAKNGSPNDHIKPK